MQKAKICEGLSRTYKVDFRVFLKIKRLNVALHAVPVEKSYSSQPIRTRFGMRFNVLEIFDFVFVNVTLELFELRSFEFLFISITPFFEFEFQVHFLFRLLVKNRTLDTSLRVHQLHG